MADGKPKGRSASSHGRRPTGARLQEGRRPVRRPAGFEPRAASVRIISGVLQKGRALDEAIDTAFAAPGAHGMEARDRAFARLIAVTVLRRLGELEAVISGFIAKPLPEKTGLLKPILYGAAAQLLYLDTPPHAAISLAVDQARADTQARRFDRLVNAVLRRVAGDGKARVAGLDGVKLDTPEWLWVRWVAAYDEGGARGIAAASLQEPALDLSVKSDAAVWAEKLGGIVLPTGSVRVKAHGRIEELPGYADGAWWVQDAAARLPGLLLGDVAGREVADLCAAPGGKTAELSAAGAKVTAVEMQALRVVRLRENLARLNLSADLVTADAATWAPGRTFDAVLLDAPCTATGTIRRHPDILRLKRNEDVGQLVAVQAALLDNAVRLVKPGGVLVYCVCSMEPEEGAAQVERALARHPAFKREPVGAHEIGGRDEMISADGDLRTRPDQLPNDDPQLAGLDGFYAARLRRIE